MAKLPYQVVRWREEAGGEKAEVVVATQKRKSFAKLEDVM